MNANQPQLNVLHIFGKLHRGGAEMRTLELMPLMKQRGVQFHFCSLQESSGPLEKDIRDLGGQIYRCPLSAGIYAFHKRFTNLLRESGVDIVHSHVHLASGYLVFLAKKAGIQGRIIHFRNTTDGKPETLARKGYQAIMRFMADKYATKVLAVCYGAMESGWGGGWQQDERCHVLYNGLNLSRFKETPRDRSQLQKELRIPADSRVVIHVGRFTRQKGHDLLLQVASEVVKENPKVHFVLVGEGNMFDQVRVLAGELKIACNVHLLGLRSDVPELLQLSDCFLLPSRWEGLPGVVLEAIAANLPVVASDLPGVREIAQHTDLVTIVPIWNRNDWAREVLRITMASEQIKLQSRVYPSAFELHHCADALYKIYCQQMESTKLNCNSRKRIQ